MSFLLVDKMVAVYDKHFKIRDEALECFPLHILSYAATNKTNIFVSSYKLGRNCDLCVLPWCEKLPSPVTTMKVFPLNLSHANLVIIVNIVIFMWETIVVGDGICFEIKLMRELRYFYIYLKQSNTRFYINK